MTHGSAELRNLDLRVDPFTLPARYAASLSSPDASDSVYLDQERAVVKRRLGGLPLTLSCPVKSFRGVAVRMSADVETGAVRTVVELLHHDPALSLPLVVVEDLDDGEDVAADWQAWGHALGLPLLIIDGDGTVRDAASHLGPLMLGDRSERRAPTPMEPRRPRFLKRRKTGTHMTGTGVVLEVISGREIIARD